MPVPEQSMVVPLSEPCSETETPAARIGSVSLMTLLQLHWPENTPDGNTMLPAAAALINPCTYTDDGWPDAEMLPDTLAANTLPAASTAAASIALGSTQPRTRLREKATEVAAGMREENLAMTTLESGLLKQDAVPDAAVEANGVAGSQANVAPVKVMIIFDCGGIATLGVKVTVMEPPDTTTVG